MNGYDELCIYDGDNIEITKDIIVTQPTLNQIKEFGEERYFSAVHTLTSVGADLKWQLWDIMNIDYTKISDYDLFIQLISQLVSSRKRLYESLQDHPEEKEKYTEEELEEMKVNPLQLTLKGIDLGDFIPCKSSVNDMVILYNIEKDITIDKLVYNRMVDAVRKIHGFKRNNEMPGNESTKMDLIDDARDEAEMAKTKPYRSMLRPLISALSVYTGQCGDDRIMNMNICKFLDNIKRVGIIQDSQLLLQGAYSGFSSLKGIDSSRLDWTREI